jgi:excisionase family DNA binding protein
VDDVMTIGEAADYIKMSERYVRRLAAERRIPFHKLGRSVRIRRVDLVAHMDAGRVEPITGTSIGLRRAA